MHPELARYIEQVVLELDTLPVDRRRQLDRLAEFVRTKRKAGDVARLTFVCTHNSRRSQMSQVWASTAAAYYGVDAVDAHSGGTESTAFNPRAVAALERAGFEVERESAAAEENPRFRLTYARQGPAMVLFSKRYDDPVNPARAFAAVMTCSEADRACPFVPGAELRISLSYEDPKVADGTPHESARYDERNKQIASEMLYLFSRVGPGGTP